MVIEHCFAVSVAQSLPPSRLAPSPAPRGPSRPRLCCCYDPARLAALIWSRNTERGPALPLFPIAFYVLSVVPGLVCYNQTRIAKGRIDDAPI